MKVLLFAFCFAVSFFLSTSAFSSKHAGDFVESVACHAHGMEITLKERLPPPRDGMWSLGVEHFPKCPGATKQDVGGEYRFSILYVDKEWCGVEPKSLFTPAWISYSEVLLILIDQNGTKIADSVSCVYNTRFETSLQTFRGEVTSENLRYGGSVEEEGTDVEMMVRSGDAVNMDFYGHDGKILEQRHVKLGDPLVFRIGVMEVDHVTSVLPETCYFSSSSTPDENPAFGETLVFVRKNCFNDRNGMVRSFLPKMERNPNGTVYELAFPAFHFTEYGQNLFVHCTLLACVGKQQLCEPKPNCFGTNRRKRSIGPNATHDNQQTLEAIREATKEFILTKYIIVEEGKNSRGSTQQQLFHQTGTAVTWNMFSSGTICMQTPHFTVLVGTFVAVLLCLIVAASCLAGRLARRKETPRASQAWYDDKTYLYSSRATFMPPTYSAAAHSSAQSLPTITSF